jgi:hypothetical protein
VGEGRPARQPRRRSLVARIVGYFLLLSLLAAIIVPLVTFFLARQALRDEVFARLDVAATLKENELNRWVEDNKADVSFIAWAPEFKANASILLSATPGSDEYTAAYALLSDYLTTILLSKPSIDEIFILSDETAQVVIHRPGKRRRLPFHRIYFTRAATTPSSKSLHLRSPASPP